MVKSFFKSILAVALALGIVGGTIPEIEVYAAGNKITNITAKGYSTNGYDASKAVDDNKSTYYLTPSANSDQAHMRTLDLYLDGEYEIDKIVVFNQLNSYNHYQIYASTTGSSFKKIAYKDSDILASDTGDTYAIRNERASIIRIVLSYNSKQMEGNLAEIELYGTKLGAANLNQSTIQVSDFEDTAWASEYHKVESDSAYANQKTIQEMSNLVSRVIGENYRSSFMFEMREASFEGKDIFEIESNADGKIIIRGNNGIAMASGFNYYLRYYCNVDYNPLFASQLKMPEQLPTLSEKIVKETQYDYRYALNFCTYSYTMAFWDWGEYEAFIDWAAMSGINTMLDIVGQEEVIRRMLHEYGYSDQEIKEYIVGPGYFAWYYMQNMTTYGGPLPDNWFETRVELGRQMHDRMQTFSIKPVLSGFSGMVPTNFKTKFSDAQTINQGEWCGYQRPDMLRTYVGAGQKDYFSEMADVFYRVQRDIFGDVTNMYAVDPFHEGGQIGDMNYTKVYETVQQKMIANDADAIWLIQQWSGSMTDAKLQGLKVKDQALILDLFSEINSSYSVMERNEIPWIWNMLHNFGGRMGLDGNPEKVSQNIPTAYQTTTQMKGIGMTPEAIENSPMVYELLWDMTWTKDPIDFRAWSQDYIKRIYGGTNADIEEVMNILLDTGYNRKDSYYQGAAESVFNARPTLNFTSASSWGHSTINYDKKELERAVYLLAKNYDTFKDSPAFIYDLSDLSRQVLANSAQEYHKAMVQALQDKNSAQFDIVSQQFLDMMKLQDRILATNEDFLVGKWIEQARTMLADADDYTKDLFEFNARSLITTWGGQKNANNGGLRDYSNRQWAGITSDYYYPRWEKWINDAKTSLANNTAMPSTNWFLMEWEWANQKSDEGHSYAISASGEDLKDLANQVYDNYRLTNLEEITNNIVEKKNIALGKPVQASVATNASYPTTNLTDGNKSTAWMATTAQNSFTLTVDLQAESSIDGMELSLKQIAGNFEYAYKVEAYRNGVWSIVSEQTNVGITSSTLIEYKGIASQVRFTLTTPNNVVPEVYELQVYGTPQQSNLRNVALGQSVTAKGTPTNRLTDGDINSTQGAGSTMPASFVLTMDQETYVKDLEVYFEKPGLGFKYIIRGTNAEGTFILRDMSNNAQVLGKMDAIAVNRLIKSVEVELLGNNGQGEFYLAWPMLAEIKLLAEVESEVTSQNVAKGKPGYVINTQNPYATTKLTDGSTTVLENVFYDYFPTTFQVDLGADQWIDEVVTYFEKPGLRFQYKVEVEKENGEKTVIQDMSNNQVDMQGSYRLPVQAMGRKVNVVIVGRAAGGSFYLATPAMTEIEVYAKPMNVIKDASVQSNVGLSESDLNRLKDDNPTTGIEVSGETNKEFIFTFDKARDIYAYELFNLGSDALQYKLEYIPYVADTVVTKALMSMQPMNENYVMLQDSTNNVNVSSKYIGQFTPVLTKQVKLTILNDTANIGGLNIYKFDATLDLASYLSSIKTKLDKLTIGNYAGNYLPSAKAVLDAVLSEEQTKIGQDLNSLEVQDEITTIQSAYNTFLKSYVAIDRTSLLVALNEASLLLKSDELVDDSLLKAAFDSAKAVYDTVKVTQQELDEAKIALNKSIQDAIDRLDAKEKLNVVMLLAKAYIDDTPIGDYNGNVSQATKDALTSVYNQALEDMGTAITASEFEAITDALQVAIDTFKDEMVVVDRSALQAAIQSVDALDIKLYSKTSWDALIASKMFAQTLDNETSSQSQVDAATAQMNALKQALVLVDRKPLIDAIEKVKQVEEANYTRSSYQALQSVRLDAEKVYTQTQVNQEDIEQAVQLLQAEIEKLVVLDRSKLQAKLEAIQKMDLSEYTSTSQKALLDVVKSANTLLQQVSLDQTTVDQMVLALDDALKALAYNRSQALIDELEALITDAKQHLESGTLYTIATYTALESAYKQAIVVLEKKLGDNEIKSSITALKNAIAGLEKKPVEPKPVKPDVQPNSKTGDTTNIGMLLLLAGCSLLMIIRNRRKKA